MFSVIISLAASPLVGKGVIVHASLSSLQPPEEMVAWLVQHEVNILFCVGGDGTQRGAHAIAQEISRQGHHIACIGIPKTVGTVGSVIGLQFLSKWCYLLMTSRIRHL